MEGQRVSVGLRPSREAARHVLRRCGAMAFDLVDRIAAELFQERVCEHERNHRFADNGRRRAQAQTSLRSIAAGASCSVFRSTDRSGFISVAMGFMNPLTRRSWPFVTPPSSPPALFEGGRKIGVVLRRQNLVVDA
jgi:hypothetical protein